MNERPSWRIAALVWWAQTWRSFLLNLGYMIFVVGVFLLATAILHINTVAAINDVFLYAVTLSVLIFIQILATRESLKNDYKFFDLKITELASRNRIGENREIPPNTRLTFSGAAGIIAAIGILCAGVGAYQYETNTDAPFRFSTAKEMVISTVEFPQGTQIIFSSDDLKDNETLSLYKCGDNCSTAKRVHWFGASELKPNSETPTVLSEAGRYYFTIDNWLPTGEVGPVTGESSEINDTTTVFHYVSGATVSVTVVEPQTNGKKK